MKPTNVSHGNCKGETRGRIRHLMKAENLERKRVPNKGELAPRDKKNRH